MLAMLEVRELSVRSRQGWLALDGVTVTAHPGEIVAVVGSNGAGKSTLLRTIAGLESAEAGTVSFRGRPLAGAAPRQRVSAGIVFAPEHARIFPGLSVLDNLRIGAWLRRDRTTVARDLARVFEWFPALQTRRRRRAEVLSGADRQMLALGRAVMSAPQVLLLDEPLAGLDAEARSRVAAIFDTLKNEGIVILVTEHGLSGLETVANRVYGLQNGRIALSGSPAAVAHAHMFAEMAESPRAEGGNQPAASHPRSRPKP
jgi:branched-chain amino acid transport system ATP-binding protein